MIMEAYYCGYNKSGNIGDDAIYRAVDNLLDGVHLVHDPNKKVKTTILGGGTIVPIAFLPWSYYKIDRESDVFILGAGVNPPYFWNTKRGAFDLHWMAGRRSRSIRRVFSKMGRIGDITVSVLSRLFDPMNFKGWYISDETFEEISKHNIGYFGVREESSKRILSKKGIESHRVADPALYLKPTEYVYKNTRKVALSLRGGYSPKWANSREYIECIKECCESILAGYKIVVLPFSTGDVGICERVNNDLSCSVLKDHTKEADVSSIMSEISQCDLMIGERLHASVLSACCHTPFVSLEYRPKNRFFCADMGVESMNARIDKISVRKLEGMIRRGLSSAKLLRTIKLNVLKARGRLNRASSRIVSEMADVGKHRSRCK